MPKTYKITQGIFTLSIRKKDKFDTFCVQINGFLISNTTISNNRKYPCATFFLNNHSTHSHRLPLKLFNKAIKELDLVIKKDLCPRTYKLMNKVV